MELAPAKTMKKRIVTDIAAEIRAYVERRPDSADTVEGIHGWWIDWGGFAESVAATWAALRLLEKEGLLERRRIGQRVLWRRKTHLSESSSKETHEQP